MNLLQLNILELEYPEWDAICIPINGIINKQERVVMGAGLAFDAKCKFKELDKRFGRYIVDNGLHVCCAFYDELMVVGVPTKIHYSNNSSKSLIKQSLIELQRLADLYELKKVAVPLLGCGNGRLNKYEVLQMMNEYLDNKVFQVVDTNV